MDPGIPKSSLISPSASEASDDLERPDALVSLTEPPPIPESHYELRIFHSLRRISRAIELYSRKLATEHQITGPQLVCLLALKKEEPLTIKKLAQLAYLSPSTVVGIVDRLEEKGLVGRSRSATDRRSVLITLTAGGHHLLASAPSPIQETLAHTLKGLPEKDKISITLALERVGDLMEARSIAADSVLDLACPAATDGTKSV